jgi:hypothetical protein
MLACLRCSQGKQAKLAAKAAQADDEEGPAMVGKLVEGKSDDQVCGKE